MRIKPLGGDSRPAVVCDQDANASAVAKTLGLKQLEGLIVVNGGTEDLSADAAKELSSALGNGLVRVAEEDRLTVITGGTDAGIFGVLGKAFEGHTEKWPLIGVAPSKLVAWDDPNNGPDGWRVPLEAHHTHFVLVEGTAWGDETTLLLDLSRELGRHGGSVAVLASGGSIARREVLGHVRQGRPIVVLAGTDRFADEVATAYRQGGSESDPEIHEIVRQGRIVVVDVSKAAQQPEVLATAIRQELEWSRQQRPHRQLPAIVRRLPRLRWRPPDPLRQLVKLEDQMSYPELAKDFVFLNDHLLDAYRRCDSEALKQQNSFYMVSLVILFGGVAATILGIVQAANVGGGFALGLAETVLTAVLGGSLVVTAAKNTQHGFYSNRLKAERLRSEYFRYVARSGAYADESTREQLLEEKVAAIEAASGLKS